MLHAGQPLSPLSRALLPILALDISLSYGTLLPLKPFETPSRAPLPILALDTPLSYGTLLPLKPLETPYYVLDATPPC